MNSEIILVLVSGGLIAAGAYFWQRWSHLVHYGKKADGIVFDHRVEYGRETTTYFPIVRYKTPDNKEYAHELRIGRETPKQKGSIVRLVYDPEDPTNVEIDSRTMLELVPRALVVAGTFGLVLVLFEVFDITALLE